MHRVSFAAKVQPVDSLNRHMPTGRFVISHRFAHYDPSDLDQSFAGVTEEVVEVDGWEEVADAVESLMLHTGTGCTVVLTVSAVLEGPEGI